MTGQSASPPTNKTRVEGHEHWALQALADDMAARHAFAHQSEMPRSEPDDANAPVGQDAET